MAINVPQNIILHCSASPDHPKENDRAAIIKYHKEVLGWSDGGYHFYVEDTDGDGEFEVLRGRAVATPGAHCLDGGMNYKSIGICMIGGDSFSGFGPSYPLPKKQWDVTVKLCAELCQEYSIPVEAIWLHRDWNMGKTCPGVGINRSAFRNDVDAMLRAEPPAHEADQVEAPHPAHQFIQQALSAQGRANEAWQKLLEVWK